MLLISCRTADTTEVFDPLSQIKIPIEQSIDTKLYQRDIANFRFSLQELRASVANKLPFEDKLQALRICRASFQKIGFLMEYYDAELYNLFNGAPVYREDHLSPGNHIIVPRGLQVVHELLSDASHVESCLEEIEFIFQQLEYYENYIASLNIDRRAIMNALYLFTIRIESLTLAGFDAPDVESEQLEVASQFLVMHQYLNKVISEGFLPTLEKEFQDPTDKLARVKLVQEYRIDIAPHTNFDNVISPMNHKQPNMYAEDFLNLSYYGNSGISNEVNDQKIALGKKLFNDPLLSKHRNFSCASCHQPDQFFTDGLKLAEANTIGNKLNRNTPTLIHSAYQSKYMYDGRAKSLEDQMLHVFNNRKEFETSVTEIVVRLKQDEAYSKMFMETNPEMKENAINLHSLTNALASYLRTLTAHQSSFDRYILKESSKISEQVVNGFNLFMGKAKCGTCHFAPTFSGLLPPFYEDSELEHIGVPGGILNGKWIKDQDEGRYNFYPNEAFKHFFKTPTIRNVAMTAPYMHNGVFATLEEVMEFYNNGGGFGHGLDYSNQTLSSDSLGLSANEMEDIILFMEALTDSTYLNY